MQKVNLIEDRNSFKRCGKTMAARLSSYNLFAYSYCCILTALVCSQLLQMLIIIVDIPQKPAEFTKIITQNDTSLSCSCVNCCEDQMCGSLWAGSIGINQGSLERFRSIHVIVSYCMHNLSWIEGFLEGHQIESLTIYSKCGEKVQGAPQLAKIITLDNLGRNDHTYAYHISRIVSEDRVLYPKSDPSHVFIFLKDNRKTSLQVGGKWRSLDEILRIISIKEFACAMELNLHVKSRGNQISETSPYHDFTQLMTYTKADYASRELTYESINQDKKEPFKSRYDNLSHWLTTSPFSYPQSTELTLVCYGGSFGASLVALDKFSETQWRFLVSSLERSNNIEEGHFAERTWGMILSKPISRHQSNALRIYANGNLPPYKKRDMSGSLARKLPQNFNLTSLTYLEQCQNEPDTKSIKNN
jgi:hypothetical protein